MTEAPQPTGPAPSGPIAYCWVQLRVRSDGTAGISVIGCIINSAGAVQYLPNGDYQFDVGVNIAYGMSNSELTTAVTSALQTSWGVTGLADVKFIPVF